MLTTVRSARTDELSDLELTELRTLVFLGFGEGCFSTDDWEHGLGGMHFIGSVAGAAVAHASVVPRQLRVDGRGVHTGYVEAVAVAEEHRRKGYGHSVMAKAGRHIEATYELGALSAAEHNQPFYRRLGWTIWPGPLAVDVEGGRRRTPEEEGGVMVLQTSRTGRLELHATLSCDWRAGDVW